MSAVQPKHTRTPPEAARELRLRGFGQVSPHPDEKAGESCKDCPPWRNQGMWEHNPTLWRVLEGTERRAKAWAGAADAKYRDCSCSSAEREAESLA